MPGWGERYCNNVNDVKNNVFFKPPSMRANQDFVKEHNRTPIVAQQHCSKSIPRVYHSQSISYHIISYHRHIMSKHRGDMKVSVTSKLVFVSILNSMKTKGQ